MIAGGGGAALGAAGVYELVDQLRGSPPRRRPKALPPEQHVLHGVRIIEDNEVEVVVPPLHHQLVTARVRAPTGKAISPPPRVSWRACSPKLEQRFEPTPAGLGITVAWGLPYFRRYVPEARRRAHPGRPPRLEDQGAGRRALLDAIRFPSDPPETILEANDVAVLLRSDRLEHIAEARRRSSRTSTSSR